MTPGQTIAHYRITAKLGEGGMGAVYRASDTKLGRDVAVKVLPPAFAEDTARMARFEREAQILAALNHPNIAAIYGIEQGALVMELVEGEDLKGPLSLDTVLDYARQIATGLEAAHAKGIIHRDLKPANIKITPSGVVKLLDFGLAKANEDAAAASSTMSPTVSLAMTQAGVILGTAAYMSPEQARGKPVDKRADIWAFGVVLFEMLIGRVLFGGGETISDTLASVMKDEPDWKLLPADTPVHIRRLLKRCLRKDPKERLRDIGDVRLLLEEPEDSPVATVVPTPQRRPLWGLWLLAGLLSAALAVTGVIAWRATRPVTRPLVRLDVDLGAEAALTRSNGGNMLALSPDGMRLAATIRGADGKVRLHTRLLRQSQFAALSGTENASFPFFSPDGQSIGFFADNKLKKVSVEGGAAVTICGASSGRGASWGEDGYIIAALGNSGPLSRVPSGGGEPVEVTRLIAPERTHRWPQILPGGDAILFTSGFNLGNYDEASIEVVWLKTGKRKTIHQGGFAARYLPSGHLVYIRQATLFAGAFDLAHLTWSSSIVPMIEDQGSSPAGGGDFAFSQTGTFVYLPGRGVQGGWPMFWLDSSGKKKELQTTAVYYSPRFSPDGKRLAYSLGNGLGADIWIKDLERDTVSKLTFLPNRNGWPVWTPDGRIIIFQSENPGAPGLYAVPADHSAEPQRLTEGKALEYPFSISPDGKRLAYHQIGAHGNYDLFTAAIEADPSGGKPGIRLGKPELFLGTKATEILPAFSPDGRWLAYSSDETGSYEIYVRPFPGPGGQTQISTGGGLAPIWSRNGHELMFQTAGSIMALDYTAKGDSFIPAGKPHVWAEATLYSPGPVTNYDLAPDGKRFAVLLPSESVYGNRALTHVTLLLNFFDEVQSKLGK